MLRFFSAIFILACLACCGNRNNAEGIPYVFVDFQINLNNPDYQNLAFDGGHVNVNGGYKGILIYRENAVTYRAFERACTYEPTSDCARIHMHESQLYFVDTCCGSQFDFQGNVISGPAPYALRQYQTELIDNYLRVYN